MKKAFLFLFLFNFFYTFYGQCWKSVSAGLFSNLAIKNDGTLWAWGDNWEGQLGDGTTINRYSPVQIGTATDWKMVSVGSHHSLAIKNNGTLWSWGNSYYGELGNGTNNDNSTIPTQVGVATNWKSVSATYWSSMAIKTDGTIWGWGLNAEYGQLGDGTTINRYEPTQIGTATDWLKVSAGAAHTIAIKTNGTLWAWGYNAYGEFGNGNNINSHVPIQVGTASNWKEALVGMYHTLALKTDGTIWSAGINSDGRLGDGTVNARNTLIQIGTDNNWEGIGIGEQNSIAIKTTGTLWTCGYNYNGLLGDGTTTERHVLTQIGTQTDWRFATTGEYNSVGLHSDDSLSTWGDNNYGQLGIGTLAAFSLTPLAITCPFLIVEEQNRKSFSLYPTPVKTVLNIQFSKVNEIGKICILDLAGKVVLEQTGNTGQINVQNLAKGLYIISVVTNREIINQKFVKE